MAAVARGMVVSGWLPDYEIGRAWTGGGVTCLKVDSEDAAVARVPNVCFARHRRPIYDDSPWIEDLERYDLIRRRLGEVRLSDNYVCPKVSPQSAYGRGRGKRVSEAARPPVVRKNELVRPF